MERREFISTLGAAATVLTASSAFAEDAATHANHSHPLKYKALAESASKCVLDGNNNLRHCYGMVSMNDTSMAECIKLTHDTIAACSALESLAAVNSPSTPAMAKVVEAICLACKKECDKFPQYSECVAMGASCKTCAEECHKITA
jgi:Cys-rich four helix bundle protein (predicted Tat secretion target)